MSYLVSITDCVSGDHGPDLNLHNEETAAHQFPYFAHYTDNTQSSLNEGNSLLIMS